MRQFWLTGCVAALAILPACTAQQTEATPPTVSYSYVDDDEYDEVAMRAEEYCEDNYDADAELLDREAEAGGYEATFACE